MKKKDIFLSFAAAEILDTLDANFFVIFYRDLDRDFDRRDRLRDRLRESFLSRDFDRESFRDPRDFDLEPRPLRDRDFRDRLRERLRERLRDRERLRESLRLRDGLLEPSSVIFTLIRLPFTSSPSNLSFAL